MEGATPACSPSAPSSTKPAAARSRPARQWRECLHWCQSNVESGAEFSSGPRVRTQCGDGYSAECGRAQWRQSVITDRSAARATGCAGDIGSASRGSRPRSAAARPRSARLEYRQLGQQVCCVVIRPERCAAHRSGRPVDTAMRVMATGARSMLGTRKDANARRCWCTGAPRQGREGRPPQCPLQEPSWSAP